MTRLSMETGMRMDYQPVGLEYLLPKPSNAVRLIDILKYLFGSSQPLKQ
jgi:hypothetical protein